MIGRAGSIKILEINAFPSITTHTPNPKKELVYSEVLGRAFKIISSKVQGTKKKLLESAINKGKIDEVYAIENYDL